MSSITYHSAGTWVAYVDIVNERFPKNIRKCNFYVYVDATGTL